MDEHLRPFAATPGKEAQKVFLAHVLRARRRIDFRLASLDHALEIVHVAAPCCREAVCRTVDGVFNPKRARSAKALPCSDGQSRLLFVATVGSGLQVSLR
jgi:hypothetical protein